MDQSPPLSQLATLSQVETEAAEALVAPISGRAMPAVPRLAVATRRLV
jgi:hypothetical protein